MRKLISILICGLLVGFSTTYAVENVVVDSTTRNVLNTGDVNFAPTQLKINGIDVVSGGNGGPGGGVTSISLSFPDIFTSPLSFIDDGNANWSATAAFATQNAFTFFGNGTANPDHPSFMDLTTARTALGISNVDNTSDANKPVSDAQGALNSTMTGNIATNATAISSLSSAFTALTLDTVAHPVADVSLASFKITNLADPTSATDAANKSYVDTAANAGPPHAAVAVATTANITRSGEQTIDGVLTSASRILVKDQTTQSENGIYVTAAGAWSRATDANTGTSVSGIVFVSGGTTQTSTSWGVTTPQPITLNTTSIVYTLTGTGGTTYTAGNGITLTGNQFGLTPIGTGRVLGNNSGSLAVPSIQVASTVGFNFLGLTNPSAVTFPRINADNTVTARSAANFLSDIGAGTVTSVDTSGTNGASDVFTYSFSATTSAPRLSVAKATVTGPVIYGTATSGSGASPSFMTAGTARGALGGTTTGQNFFTIANPAASTLVFPRVVDNVVTLQTASAIRQDMGASFVDLGVNFTNAGTSAAPSVWTAGATAAIETVALSANRYATLPPASGYPPGRRITYSDNITPAANNVGRFFRPNTGDLLNGVADDAGHTADFQPFIGARAGAWSQKSIEFEALSASGNPPSTAWRVLNTASTLFHVEDSTDPTKQIIFDASNQTSGTPGTIKAANNPSGPSVTVIPSDLNSEVVRQINTGGGVVKSQLAPAELLPTTYTLPVGGGGNIAAGSNFTVPTNGVTQVDTVRITGNLQGSITIVWPDAGNYENGGTITLIDDSGTVSGENYVIVSSATGNLFNGSSTLRVDEQSCRRVFTSSGPGSTTWSAPLNKAGNKPYVQRAATVISGAHNFTITADSSIISNKYQLNLFSGTNNLIINQPYDGAEFDLILVQPNGGTPAAINLPAPSAVGSTGNGLVVLTTTNPAVQSIDRLRGVFVGGLGMYLWEPVIKDYTTATIPAAPSAIAATGATSTTVTVTWTDNQGVGAGAETGFKIYRAATGTTNFNEVGNKAAVSGSGSTVSFTDSGLNPNTNYNYTVAACNSAGCSPISGAGSPTPDDGTTLVGGAPADIWQLKLNQGSGTLANGDVASRNGLLGYDSWISNGSGFAYRALAGLKPVTALSVTPTGGSGTTNTYTYRVFACTADGRKSFATTSTPINNGPPPATPQLDATHKNNISWTASTGTAPHHYEVWRTAVPSGSINVSTGRLAISQPFTGTSFSDDGTTTTDLPLGQGGNVTTATDIYNITSCVGTSPCVATPINYGVQTVTMTFWIKSTGLGITDNLFTLGGGQGVNLSTAGGNKFSITIRDFSTPQKLLTGTISSTTINDGNWHFIAVVLDNSTSVATPSTNGTHVPDTAADNILLYFDGNNPQTMSYSSVPGVARTPGNFATTLAVLGANGLVADIDDVRIYGSKLSGSQIQTLFTDGAQ